MQDSKMKCTFVEILKQYEQGIYHRFIENPHW